MEIRKDNIVIIGVDFDNTIINYNRLIYEKAIELKLIPNNIPLSKKVMRDHIRKQPNGEKIWQKIQAIIYGSCIYQADLAEGVLDFFKACIKKRILIHIVSHKTQFARRSPNGPDLIQNATDWIETNGFFSIKNSFFNRKHVFFEPTRSAKVERIRLLKCTHFIDDLEETFAEPTFPNYSKKILYSEIHSSNIDSQLIQMKNWREIYKYFFNPN